MVLGLDQHVETENRLEQGRVGKRDPLGASGSDAEPDRHAIRPPTRPATWGASACARCVVPILGLLAWSTSVRRIYVCTTFVRAEVFQTNMSATSIPSV